MEMSRYTRLLKLFEALKVASTANDFAEMNRLADEILEILREKD